MKKQTCGMISLLVVLLFLFSGCQKEVTDFKYTLNLNSKVYEGAFSGSVEKGVPVDGKGRFVSGAEGSGNYFLYDGNWKDGMISGAGTMTDESYEIELSVGKRTGKYTGDVENGIANGNGKFESQNSSGIEWYYEGNWKNGKMNGQGKAVFKNGEGGVQEGTYTDNEFTPTLVERIQEFGTRGSDRCQYVLSDSEKDFIMNNASILMGKDLSGLSDKIDKSFSVEQFKKNPNSFSPAFVAVENTSIVQISEYEESGDTITFCIADTEDYETTLYLYMIGSSKDAVENSTADICFLPLDYTTYKNASDSEVWAIAGVAVFFNVI